MKTYSQVIYKLANDMYHSYMSGSNEYYRVGDGGLIGFIYSKTASKVNADIKKRFERMLKEKNSA